MNPKTTLQTLTLDCVLQILRYVPLPECMFLRASCRQLKIAVDEHFRTGVQALPVLLSSRFSSQQSTIRPACQDPFYMEDTEFVETTFGSASGISQEKIWELKTTFPVLKWQFRPENYLIVFGLARRFEKFINFIAMYLPGVTELALVIHDDLHFPNLLKILNLYGKQLKALTLEKTMNSNETIHKLNWEGLHSCIVNLPVLEELYYFPKSQGFVGCKRQFIVRLLGKLRVLHMIHNFRPLRENHIEENDIEELGCLSIGEWRTQFQNFPKLKKCFLRNDQYLHLDLVPKSMPNLRELCIEMLHFSEQKFETLNHFRNLEKIQCAKWYFKSSPDVEKMKSNKTVEFIEIDSLHGDNTLEMLKVVLRFFQSLKKVVVRKPFMELTGSDISIYINSSQWMI